MHRPGRPRYKAKRDNAFYERHLKKKRRDIYERWKIGDYASLRQALIAAGIKRETTGLDLLERGWKKASLEERSAFFLSDEKRVAFLLSDLD
jgi:hypothetical protein